MEQWKGACTTSDIPYFFEETLPLNRSHPWLFATLNSSHTIRNSEWNKCCPQGVAVAVTTMVIGLVLGLFMLYDSFLQLTVVTVLVVHTLSSSSLSAKHLQFFGTLKLFTKKKLNLKFQQVNLEYNFSYLTSITAPQDTRKRLVLQVYLGSNTVEFSAMHR